MMALVACGLSARREVSSGDVVVRVRLSGPCAMTVSETKEGFMQTVLVMKQLGAEHGRETGPSFRMVSVSRTQSSNDEV